MKNLYFLVCLFFISNAITAQQTFVPDDNFEQALINLGYDDVLDNYVLTSNINSITHLDVSHSRFGIDDFGIIDLTGIEAFESLVSLDCSNNNIIRLNLSSNTALKDLFCPTNDLTYLNVASNSSLKTLICDANELTELDVRFNPALEFLYCVDNHIMSIDASLNPVLERLRCSNNDLVFLNIKNGNNVNVNPDVVLGFEAYNNPDLDCIIVDDVAYSNANWTHKDAHSIYSESCGLTYVPDDNFEQYLIGSGWDTGPLDDYVLTANIIGVNNMFLNNRNISDFTGIEDFTDLTFFDCSSNNLTSIDVSSNLALTELNCSSNNLTSIDVSNNSLLFDLYCQSNNLTSLDVSSNRSLNSLECQSNDLTSLDVSSNSGLRFLDCSSNNLRSLNVQNGNNRNMGLDARINPDLTCIQVDEVHISIEYWPYKDETATYSQTCLDEFTVLIDFEFEQVLIDLGYDDTLNGHVLTRDIIGIKELNINNKNISDLTGIEDFIKLETLKCKNNKLTSLDLSPNTVLTVLDCSDNQLDALNLRNGNNINFTYLNTTGNPDLMCIQIDEIDFCNDNWSNNTNENRHFCIDKHTKFSEDCNFLSVSEILDTNYKIYPNPVKDVLNIKLNPGLQLKQVNIYNIFGQFINRNKTSKIDVSNLSSGMYFIEIETNQGKSAKKIVIE